MLAPVSACVLYISMQNVIALLVIALLASGRVGVVSLDQRPALQLTQNDVVQFGSKH